MRCSLFKKVFLGLIFFSLMTITPSCGVFNKTGYTQVVKAKKRSRPYNAKKDRHSKRTKKVYRKLGY